MGLDMNITKRVYMAVQPWREDQAEQQERYEMLMQATNTPMPKHMDMQWAQVDIDIAYWRKANAIHAWFVDTLAEGVDECQRISLNKEHLEALLALVAKSLKDGFPHLATRAGFFFGDTNYDEWYWNQMKHTSAMLEEIIESWDENAIYYYQASW